MPMKKPRFNWLRQRPRKIVGWFQRHEKTASWGTTIFTGLIFLVTAIYVTVVYFQLRAMHSSVAQTQALIEQQKEALGYAKTQAETSQRQTYLAEQSVRDAAQSARDSAEVARETLAQNKDLIKSAQVQARTSQVAARAADRSASIAQDTFRLVYRPTLGVDGAEITKFKEGEEIEGAIRFKNSGQTVARNTTVRSHFSTEPAGSISRPCPDVTNPPLAGLGSRSQIPVGGFKSAVPRSFVKASAEDIKRIESGQWWLYVYAIVRYEGSTGGQYFTSFYARWNSVRRTFDECDSNNEAN
jgi:hypothetical protein